jgi:peptidoglycan/LPS O-acetylase OafA/YrhL
MSLAGLALVLGYVARYGVVHHVDEGTAARLWQLLMGGQLPIIAYFAVRWLPRTPREALLVLAVQALAGFASLAAVLILENGPHS